MDARWTVRTMDGVASVDAEAWDALVPADHVFERHAFLAHLERTGCLGRDRGWLSVPVVVEDAAGRLIGAAPAGVKDHGYGEYIFDWGWADAAKRHGIPYYPKVVVSVPYTPATGPRLLRHPEADSAAVQEALARGVQAVADQVEAGVTSWLFVEREEVAALEAAGLQGRLTHQYHWLDPGFGDFDGYLAAMRSRRRKEVRRERRQARESGYALAVERITDLSEEDLDRLHRCYLSTIEDHWAQAYLTRVWWLDLPSALPDHAIVATARDGGRLVAGSLAFTAGRNLYGRYWGSLVDAPALHFELCYYQLIEWALAHGITRVEAGAQGQHKIPRGFLPHATWSAHRVRHPGLRDAVMTHLAHERRLVQQEMSVLSERSPYREGVVPLGLVDDGSDDGARPQG